MPFPTRPPALVTGGPCRFCGRALPADRAVHYCPACGLDVTRLPCPACSTPLELDWKFCITCGRPIGEGDGGRPIGEGDGGRATAGAGGSGPPAGR